MLDGNTYHEKVRDAQEMQREEVYARHEKYARWQLEDEQFQDPTAIIEAMADDFIDFLGDDFQAMRLAISKRDDMEIGRIIVKCATDYISDWMETKEGQERLDEIVNELERDCD